MRELLRNIARKIFLFIIAFAVLTINIPSLIFCSNMISGDECCHIQITVKPCCVKKLKITFDERISGHCGCTMKESPAASDMFIDLSVNQQSLQKVTNDFEPAVNLPMSLQEVIRPQIYLPPIRSVTETYLTNLNLRI